MPTPEELALAQIQGATQETPAVIAGRELAETQAEVFVQRLKTFHPDKDAVIQFTMSYFQNLKTHIDAGVEAL